MALAVGSTPEAASPSASHSTGSVMLGFRRAGVPRAQVFDAVEQHPHSEPTNRIELSTVLLRRFHAILFDHEESSHERSVRFLTHECHDCFAW